MPHDPGRRDFLQTACGPVVLALLGISLPACETLPTEPLPGGLLVADDHVALDLSHPDLASLRERAGHLHIADASMIVVNVDGDAFRAFSDTCTHLGGTLQVTEDGTFYCPQHGSRFDTDGEVTRGPAEDDLPRFAVHRTGDLLTITRPG